MPRPSKQSERAASAEYCRRVARRISRMVFSALSFVLGITVPPVSNDEPKYSFVQTTISVQPPLTGLRK